MATTLRYRVVVEGGIFIGETCYPFGSIINLTQAAARYLVYNGLIVLHSGQAPEPTNPEDPSEDDIRLTIRVDNRDRIVTVAEFMRLLPSLSGSQGGIDAAIAALIGSATGSGNTLGELEGRIALLESGQGGGPSAGANQTKTFICNSPISGHRIVRAVADRIEHASSLASDAAAIKGTIGLSLSSGVLNETVTVLLAGQTTDPSFNFSPGPIWLGLNGNLSQTPPTSGSLQIVGRAVSQRTIIISIEAPIVLS